MIAHIDIDHVEMDFDRSLDLHLSEDFGDRETIRMIAGASLATDFDLELAVDFERIEVDDLPSRLAALDDP